VIHPGDGLPGPVRDRLQREGGFFAAPVEFYSEVFLDGKPLARPHFDAGARELPDGTRTMPVHCPRFGPVTLAVTPDHHKFITSVPEPSAELLAELRATLITE
jgi:hypothetical protein